VEREIGMTTSRKKALEILKELANAYCNRCLQYNKDAECGYCNMNGLGNALIHNIKNECSIKESVQYAHNVINSTIAHANARHDNSIYRLRGKVDSDYTKTGIAGESSEHFGDFE
jgi:hypothetical protein